MIMVMVTITETPKTKGKITIAGNSTKTVVIMAKTANLKTSAHIVVGTIILSKIAIKDKVRSIIRVTRMRKVTKIK